MFKQLQADLAKEHHIHFNDLTLLEEALTQANYTYLNVFQTGMKVD